MSYPDFPPTTLCRMVSGGATNWSPILNDTLNTFNCRFERASTVLSVERADKEDSFLVRTRSDGQAEETVVSRSIVIASGIQQMPKFPPTRSRLPHDITQLHTADYRNAAALPPGAVVVVGSGQSGCQIAEDLLSAGRTVYLCTSKVGRAPRRYRGRDSWSGGSI